MTRNRADENWANYLDLREQAYWTAKSDHCRRLGEDIDALLKRAKAFAVSCRT